MANVIRNCPESTCSGKLLHVGTFTHSDTSAQLVYGPGDDEPELKDVTRSYTLPAAQCDTCQRYYYPDGFGWWDVPIESSTPPDYLNDAAPEGQERKDKTLPACSPFPWKANVTVAELWNENKDEPAIGIFDANGELVTTLDCLGHPYANARANARVIQAAPEMEAAILAADAAGRHYRDCDYCDNESWCEEMLALHEEEERLLKIALGKLKGEVPDVTD